MGKEITDNRMTKRQFNLKWFQAEAQFLKNDLSKESFQFFVVLALSALWISLSFSSSLLVREVIITALIINCVMLFRAISSSNLK